MQQIARQKHIPTYEDLNPNTKFVNSAIIHLLDNSDSLNDHLAAKALSWRNNPDFVKLVFNTLSQSAPFNRYMSSPEGSIKEDIELMEYLFVEVLQSEELSEEVEKVIEETSIMMSGDLSFVLPLVMRTITSIKASHRDLKVVKMFKNKEDEVFLQSIFERSLINYTRYQEYIERLTDNWDVERIVLMDNMIIAIAMAELLNCPDVPTKVTMDEYIEIAKDYSTPSSSVFVNGMLDRITVTLNEEGLIKKVGRGLL